MTTKHIDDSFPLDALRAIGDRLFIEKFTHGLMCLEKMEATGKLTATQAKQVLDEMVETGASPEDIAAERGFEVMDDDELTRLVDKAIKDNSVAWQKYCDGEDKVAGVFVGALMKATRGRVDGQAATIKLQERRDKQTEGRYDRKTEFASVD